MAIDLPAADEVRVEVLTDDGDPRLAAAIEIVSPRNKDRPAARRAFVGKCAEHLRHGRGVVVVDAVISDLAHLPPSLNDGVLTRRADLHADLLGELGADPDAATPAGLLAVAYRTAGRDDAARLLAWPAPLAVGRALPTLPLWLAADLAVPLDLDASYRATCDELRVRQAG